MTLSFMCTYVNINNKHQSTVNKTSISVILSPLNNICQSNVNQRHSRFSENHELRFEVGIFK